MSDLVDYLYSFINLLRHIFESDLTIHSKYLSWKSHFPLQKLFFLWTRKKTPLILCGITHLPHIHTYYFNFSDGKSQEFWFKTFPVILKFAPGWWLTWRLWAFWGFQKAPPWVSNIFWHSVSFVVIPVGEARWGRTFWGFLLKGMDVYILYWTQTQRRKKKPLELLSGLQDCNTHFCLLLSLKLDACYTFCFACYEPAFLLELYSIFF